MRKRCEEAGVKLKKSEGVGAEFIEKIHKSQEAAGMLVKEQKEAEAIEEDQETSSSPPCTPICMTDGCS